MIVLKCFLCAVFFAYSKIFLIFSQFQVLFCYWREVRKYECVCECMCGCGCVGVSVWHIHVDILTFRSVTTLNQPIDSVPASWYFFLQLFAGVAIVRHRCTNFNVWSILLWLEDLLRSSCDWTQNGHYVYSCIQTVNPFYQECISINFRSK